MTPPSGVRSSVPSGDAAVSVILRPSSSGSDRFGGGPEAPLQGVQPVGPFEAVGLQPSIELHQRLRSQAVEAALGVAPHLDEAGVAQHLEVARHPGLVHPHLGHQLPDDRSPPRTASRMRRRVGSAITSSTGRLPGTPEHTHLIYMCKQIFRTNRRSAFHAIPSAFCCGGHPRPVPRPVRSAGSTDSVGPPPWRRSHPQPWLVTLRLSPIGVIDANSWTVTVVASAH